MIGSFLQAPGCQWNLAGQCQQRFQSKSSMFQSSATGLCILCQVLEKAQYSMKRTFELPWSLPNPEGNYSRESEGWCCSMQKQQLGKTVLVHVFAIYLAVYGMNLHQFVACMDWAGPSLHADTNRISSNNGTEYDNTVQPPDDWQVGHFCWCGLAWSEELIHETPTPWLQQKVQLYEAGLRAYHDRGFASQLN